MATKKQTTKTAAVETPAVKASAPKTTASNVTATTENNAPAAKKTTEAKSRKVTFVLPKEAVENAETVALLGDFNNWDTQKQIELKKQKDGSFKTAVELEAGRAYQYRFLINGERWENAWEADAYEPTPFGAFNSVVKA
jgi:1,4-alpha-glucan branching enzyme